MPVTRHRRGRNNTLTFLAALVVASIGMSLSVSPFLAASVLATPEADYLHAASVTLGSVGYMAASTAMPTGAVATRAAAPIDASTFRAFTLNGRSIWVSPATPTGTSWDLSGEWSFNTYVQADITSVLVLRALIYRVDSSGTLVPLATSYCPKPYTAGTTAGPVTWSFTVTEVMLNPSERWGVEFQALASAKAAGDVHLLIDSAAAGSSVAVPNAVPQAPTSTATWTPTPAATSTSTVSPTPGSTFTPSATSSGTPTLSPTTTSPGPTTTPLGGMTATPTPIATDSATHTPSWSATATLTPTATVSATRTATATVTGAVRVSPLMADPTTTPTATMTPTATISATATLTPTATVTPTPTATFTPANTPTPQGPAHNGGRSYRLVENGICAACHRAHTSPAPVGLQEAWPEEEACYVCHDGSGAPNVKTQLIKPNSHPVSATTGVHSESEIGTRQPTSFNGKNRHVECQDCHEPHAAGQSTHARGTNYASGPLQGDWGVAVSNTAAWAAPVFTTTLPLNAEYQLCYKCHSSWTYGGTPPISPSGSFTETDQALEFNTMNPSYHPVEGVGKNPFITTTITATASYAGALINGWTPSSTMYCSDCHRSDTPSDLPGAHGSNQPFMLGGRWSAGASGTGKTGTASDICFQCHDWNSYGQGATTTSPTGFSSGTENLHTFHMGQPAVTSCQSCHSAVPHGSPKRALLAETTDPAPYNQGGAYGSQLQVLTWDAPGNWQKGDCGTCHAGTGLAQQSSGALPSGAPPRGSATAPTGPTPASSISPSGSASLLITATPSRSITPISASTPAASALSATSVTPLNEVTPPSSGSQTPRADEQSVR